MAITFFHKKTLISDLSKVLENYLTKDEIDLVKKAYKVAKIAHEGQYRQSGEPYIHHPLAVALILAELELDYYCIVAAILHDCIEDTIVTKEDISETFGEQVAHIVEGVSNLTNLEFTSSSQKQASNFQKLFFAMSKDMRVMVIKLADRLHNMRTIDSVSPEKRMQKAKETAELHAPIARRLGLHSIRVELDNICFQTIHPYRYGVLKRKIKNQYGNQKKLMDERLNLTLNVNDPFGLSGMGFETWGDIDEDGTRDWYQEANRNWSSQTLRLTLEYRFGKMEDKSRFSRQRGEGMEMEEGSGEIF